MNIAVVIAAYKEEGVIRKVVSHVPQEIEGLGSITTIVVDDGSYDNTAAEARAGGAIVLSHLINRGQGAALKTGFDYAVQQGYDVVVSFDADDQHNPCEIADLVRTLVERDLDVVLGSRFLNKASVGLSGSRRLVLKAGVLFTRLISSLKVTDTHNGFRAFRRDALRTIRLVQDRMEHASEILDQISKHQLSFTEVPVTIAYTDYSKKKGQKSSEALKIAGKMLMYKLLN